MKTAETAPKYSLRPLVLLLFIAGAASLFFLCFELGYADRHFVWQAEAFLNGRLDLDPAHMNAATAVDTTIRGGKYYWPLGPLPAVMYVPLVAVLGATDLTRSIGHVAAVIATWILAYALARRSGCRSDDAAWLVLAFAFGSAMIGASMLPLPWYLADIVCALLMLAALLESKGRDRPLVLGALLGLTFTSRLTAGAIGLVFFLVLEMSAVRTMRERVIRLVKMAVPIALALLLFAVFNAARFGSPLDTGYGDSRLDPGGLATDRAQLGLFDVSYVRRNLYEYFVRPPDLINGIPVPNKHGYSLVLLAPTFLWLFMARRRTPYVMPTLAASVAAFAIYLPYYSSGASQFGPRYLVDVLAFWFVLLVAVFRERGLGAAPRAVIGASALVNIILANLYALHSVHGVF